MLPRGGIARPAETVTVLAVSAPTDRLARRITLPAPTLDPTRLSWSSQVHQYPRGRPGLTCFQATHEDYPLAPIDCLIERDRQGYVIGILNHFGHDMPPLERAGNVNVLVHPAMQRRGIGTRLLLTAMDLWPDIDLMAQTYTPAGRSLAASCSRRLGAAAPV